MGRKWTEEEIEFLKENYEDMTASEIGEKLNRSAPSVGQKARSLGLRKQKSTVSWTKEKVVARLQELAEKHGKEYLQDSNLNENECSLYSAARRYFDSLEEAVEKAGFDYEDLRKRDNWTKEKVIEEIKDRGKEKGKAPSCEDDPSLTQAAYRFFESWAAAVKEAGYEPRRRFERWTEKEIDFLKKNYEEMDYEEIGEKLNRSAHLVGQKARRLGLKKISIKEWTDEEIKFLKNNYGETPTEEIADKLERSKKSVQAKAYSLNLGLWSDEEIEFLKNNHGQIPIKEIADKLEKSKQSVLGKITGLGLELWSKENIDFLMNNYQEMTYEEIASELGVCKGTVGRKARELGLEKRPSKDWSSSEIEFLKKNYEEMDYEEIGEKLNRSAPSVGHKARRLGLEVINPKGYWNEEIIIEKLQDLAEKEGKNFLTPSSLKENVGSLYGATRKVFGSVRKGVEKAGFNYDEIISQKPTGFWSEEKIIERLQELVEKHGKDYLYHSNLKRNHPSLLSAAQKKFESFSEAVEEAGFDYEEIKRPNFGERVRWYGWEECCKEISNLLFDSGKILFKEKLGETRLEPDLQVPDENLIIDAKLNAWDMKGISRDIDSYSPFCDRLEFWCLEGERGIVPEDVEIVSSEELLERLEENGLSEEGVKEFEKKMEMIKRGINPYEEGQEELDEF